VKIFKKINKNLKIVKSSFLAFKNKKFLKIAKLTNKKPNKYLKTNNMIMKE
jgi:hypothetical protein